MMSKIFLLFFIFFYFFKMQKQGNDIPGRRNSMNKGTGVRKCICSGTRRPNGPYGP